MRGQGRVHGSLGDSLGMGYSLVENFDLGTEGSRLREFVREQLHGEATRKNEMILLQFQKDAELRKHRRLNRLSQAPSRSLQQRAYTIENGALARQHQHPLPPRLRYALIPAPKHPPPIYSNSRVELPANSYNHLAVLRDGPSPIPPPTPPQRHRGREKNSEGGHARSWALRGIKEEASRRRRAEEGMRLQQQLQRERRRKERECREISRRLLKLKKYRHYIRVMEGAGSMG